METKIKTNPALDGVTYQCWEVELKPEHINEQLEFFASKGGFYHPCLRVEHSTYEEISVEWAAADSLLTGFPGFSHRMSSGKFLVGCPLFSNGKEFIGQLEMGIVNSVRKADNLQVSPDIIVEVATSDDY